MAPLRGREDFRLLLLDLAFPADPVRRGALRNTWASASFAA